MSSADDRMPRARIRDAAIARFARDGFGASVRQIAEDAGVSPALVIHHFGSKAALRQACDAAVLREYAAGKDEGQRVVRDGDPLSLLSELGRYEPLLGYFLQTIREGGESARRIVREMIADADARTPAAITDGLIHPSPDPHARNRVLVLAVLGALTLSDLVDSDGRADESAGGSARRLIERVYVPLLEVLTHGYLTSPDIYDAFRRTHEGDQQ
ncbi:TetR family transcriptional regulator [Microbacterium sp. Marseille-Q6965]|uniref:TetR family transcriptional regulator n=1 Tax=Microbacterium sp. Marseille-Q6965 TaxID=2965072 RepID=UPI0021B7F1DD|nr:TetR family transcriptional regulator [Microbacterium sp. Marseille-Q6965]